MRFVFIEGDKVKLNSIVRGGMSRLLLVRGWDDSSSYSKGLDDSSSSKGVG